MNIILFFFHAVPTSLGNLGKFRPSLTSHSTELTPEAAGLTGYFVATTNVDAFNTVLDQLKM